MNSPSGNEKYQLIGKDVGSPDLTVKKKLTKKISKTGATKTLKKTYSTLKSMVVNDQDFQHIDSGSEETSFADSEMIPEIRTPPVAMRSSELVRLAAAKKKQNNTRDEVVRSSSNVNSMDELRVLFAGKNGGKKRFSPMLGATPITNLNWNHENIKPHSTKIEGPQIEEISDFMKISTTFVGRDDISKNDSKSFVNESFERSNDKKDKMNSGLELPILYFKDKENREDLTDSTKKEFGLLKKEGYNDIQDAMLLLVFDVAMEAELPSLFFEKLFQEHDLHEAMNQRGDLFRKSFEMMCQIHQL